MFVEQHDTDIRDDENASLELVAMVQLERARAEDDARGAVLFQSLRAERILGDAEIVPERALGERTSSTLFHAEKRARDGVVGVGARHRARREVKRRNRRRGVGRARRGVSSAR